MRSRVITWLVLVLLAVLTGAAAAEPKTIVIEFFERVGPTSPTSVTIPLGSTQKFDVTDVMIYNTFRSFTGCTSHCETIVTITQMGSTAGSPIRLTVPVNPDQMVSEHLKTAIRLLGPGAVVSYQATGDVVGVLYVTLTGQSR